MSQRWFGLTLIAPAFALMALVLLSPMVYGFVYTLFRIEYAAPTEFIGLGNYLHLLEEPALGATVWRSAVYAALAVALTVAISLGLALIIHRMRPRAAFILQIVVIVPWIISTVVAALLFRWVFVNDIGLAAHAARLMGWGEFHPLATSTGAMALLIAVSVWKRIGYAMIVLLAGLKAIPAELEEAARVDGARPRQVFRFVTLPLLKTPLLLVTIVLTLSNLNTVETPLVMTGGGPGTATRILPIEVYELAFAHYDFGSAATLAVLMFVGNVLLVLSYVRLVRWRI
jgi:ABC-type sugar transport system permease subunit